VDDLLPPDVRIGALRVRDRADELIGAELEPIADAVERRRAAYSSGRVLSRRLLTELGAPPARPLGRRPGSRLPDWPEGFVGSITHSGPLCLAAVGRSARYRGLGLDLEPDQPTRQEIDRHVLSDRERGWVADATRAGEDRSRLTRLVFSVKEAVYKAFHPAVGRVWGFQDVEVEIDLGRGRFLARLPEDAGPATIAGSVLRRDAWIVSAVAWRRSEDR
jgi:4'-phosphopantetheinyl transferase EntD